MKIKIPMECIDITDVDIQAFAGSFVRPCYCLLRTCSLVCQQTIVMSGKTRSLYGTAFRHFLNSLKPRQAEGKFVGDDYHGNKYYEVPADPSRGKRHPKRWYVPPVDMRYDQDYMPAEWDAWLRNRRADPPVESELKENLTVAAMKKANAEKLAEKEGKKHISVAKQSDVSSFPEYDDYEKTPGEGIRQK